MSQYFEYDPSLKDDIKHYEYTFKGYRLSFKTNSGIFSKERVDFGTNVLLNGLDDLSNNDNVYIGGGDTISAVNKYNKHYKYSSSGGGATLEYVAFGNLKALEWIKENEHS